jgi:hypothetical protein
MVLMDGSMTFLDCPAYLDDRGDVRCGLPAGVEYRFVVESTDGPLESAKIRCPNGHWFNAPLESLIWRRDPDPAAPERPKARPDRADRG